jgi:hypothetical protein
MRSVRQQQASNKKDSYFRTQFLRLKSRRGVRGRRSAFIAQLGALGEEAVDLGVGRALVECRGMPANLHGATRADSDQVVS